MVRQTRAAALRRFRCVIGQVDLVAIYAFGAIRAVGAPGPSPSPGFGERAAALAEAVSRRLVATCRGHDAGG